MTTEHSLNYNKLQREKENRDSNQLKKYNSRKPNGL